ncbi:hypothetical protein V1512DRAFT_208426 [Lipomyces arxii]|uniref:uncharacterized protein n=1 Tax=Lipomyces arxii TaxID=56418 RepID=UPI0034CFD158
MLWRTIDEQFSVGPTAEEYPVTQIAEENSVSAIGEVHTVSQTETPYSITRTAVYSVDPFKSAIETSSISTWTDVVSTSTPDDGLWHTIYGHADDGLWHTTYDHAGSTQTVFETYLEATMSLREISQPAQTLFVTDTPTIRTYPVVSVSLTMESGSVETIPTQASISVSVSPSVTPLSTVVKSQDLSVMVGVYSYTSTVKNSMFTPPLEVAYYTTVTSTVDLVGPTYEAVTYSATERTADAITETSEEGTSTITAKSLVESSYASAPVPSTHISSSESAFVHSIVLSSTALNFETISTRQPSLSLYTVSLASSVESSTVQSNWGIETSLSSAIPYTEHTSTLSETKAPERSLPVASTLSSLSDPAIVPTSVSALTVTDAESSASSSLTFLTNQPWTQPVLTTTVAPEASPTKVSLCPIDGQPCTVHGEMACNGYYYGQCVWGTWVVRQCYTGLSCKNDGTDVYCAYPGPDPVTSCSAGTSTFIKRSTSAVGHSHSHHRRAKMNDLGARFYEYERGKHYSPHVPVKRRSPDMNADVTDDESESLPVTGDIIGNVTAFTRLDEKATSADSSAVIQTLKFSAILGTLDAYSTATYDPADASVSDRGVSTENTGSFLIRISTQRLDSTRFVGTLYAAPLANNPISQSWTFSFTSSHKIDRISRGDLSFMGNAYKISSIATEEASNYMAIMVIFWGEYT